LDELEKEEDRLIESGYYDSKMEMDDDESKDIKKLAKKYANILPSLSFKKTF
jgi:hypothetical protein